MGIKHWLTAAVTTGLACASTFAQEQARVLSAIPVMQQVGVPQQFCENEQVYSGQRTNGTGAIIGAIALTLLQEAFQSQALLGEIATHWHLTFGLAIIALVAVLPKGLTGIPDQWRARRSKQSASTTATAGH